MIALATILMRLVSNDQTSEDEALRLDVICTL